ncbi:MAG TPA: hypothetical protein VK601_17550 [Kofleriaceae bacterium]|nr:hypothetical protein [Kofleriaceae bacterium]
MPVQRVCDGADPTTPCDLDDLHRGDLVQIRAVFSDQDGEEADGVLQWRVSACNSGVTGCDPHRLYEGAETSPHFVVPPILEGTGEAVQRVVIELDVFDELGASSSESEIFVVHDGPTLVVSRSAPGYTVGSPINLFATYGDPDGTPAGRPPEVVLTWTPLPPSGQPPPPLIDLEVPQNPADPAHVIVGQRLVPPEAGAWDVRVIATNARRQINEKHLRFAVEPAPPPGGRERSWR